MATRSFSSKSALSLRLDKGVKRCFTVTLRKLSSEVGLGESTLIDQSLHLGPARIRKRKRDARQALEKALRSLSRLCVRRSREAADQ